MNAVGLIKTYLHHASIRRKRRNNRSFIFFNGSAHFNDAFDRGLQIKPTETHRAFFSYKTANWALKKGEGINTHCDDFIYHWNWCVSGLEKDRLN